MRPLLLAHQVSCDGPWTPTKDLEGIIAAKGLIPGMDEVHIRVKDRDDTASQYIASIREDTEFNLGPLRKEFIQAAHVLSSGEEVFIWVS